jgi:hypothetical protein
VQSRSAVPVASLDLAKFQQLAKALAESIREYNRAFGWGTLTDGRQSRAVQQALRTLTGEAKRLGLSGVVDGNTRLEGARQRCGAIGQILLFSGRLALTGIPLSRPISNQRELEDAVAVLSKSVSKPMGAPIRYPKSLEKAIALIDQGAKDQKVYNTCAKLFPNEQLPKMRSFMRTVQRHRALRHK